MLRLHFFASQHRGRNFLSRVCGTELFARNSLSQVCGAQAFGGATPPRATKRNKINNKQKETMNKKEYKKPAMQVVLIQQHAQLLAGSVGATRDGYGTAIEDTWGETE